MLDASAVRLCRVREQKKEYIPAVFSTLKIGMSCYSRDLLRRIIRPTDWKITRIE
jgi:hypothetical protein